MIGRGNRSTRRKPAPVPHCPPQTPHAARKRTRAAAVGSQRLTALDYNLRRNGRWSSLYILGTDRVENCSQQFLQCCLYTLLSDDSGIVACLHSGCLAMAVSPGSTIPAFIKYATIYKKTQLIIHHRHCIGRCHYETGNKK
jgi:hypothetical protein